MNNTNNTRRVKQANAKAKAAFARAIEELKEAGK